MKFGSTITSALILLLAMFALAACSVSGRSAASSEQFEVRKYIASINDDPDRLHSDDTPSVRRLIAIGRPALQYGVLDLLLESENHRERIRALGVLAGIVSAEFGFVQGQGWRDEDSRLQCRMLWIKNGDLKHDSSYEERSIAVEKWKAWIANSRPVRTDGDGPKEK